ncbi:energy transducer TonB [Granulicella sp. 5B5]|uniref:TonB C-terminal domain-containing protein n=1 Tax=Granulicella sp. 5B5 TaxID=1617967 RepID=UPI0015F75ABA|nr:TonB C-terminal domain-containing protein [Granulicella sp. 5B5]QMV19362.1 energy transducer TonB [Granulicella sp. 5B5]
MPTSTQQRDPERIETETELPIQAVETPFVASATDEQLHVVPPSPQPAGQVRIRTRRGELDEHELMRMLDSIEDELARRRFRESLYISFFICVAMALVVLYGPRYLWHAPQLVNPADVLKNREMIALNAPVLPHPAPHIAPKMDTKTLEHLREERPTPPAPTPRPAEPTPPQPAAATPPAPAPTATPAAPLPSAPKPAPALAEAPAPQPTTSRPTFGTPSTSDAMKDLLHSSRGGSTGTRDMVRTGKGAFAGGGVTVLSDTQGVDFSDYLRRLQMDVYRNWIPLLPEETEPPLMKQGETYIRFTILPDGKIGNMVLEGSSHDVAIDKAAWGSIISEGQFPPLPKQFHGPNLELRFHYMVNKNLPQ